MRAPRDRSLPSRLPRFVGICPDDAQIQILHREAARLGLSATRVDAVVFDKALASLPTYRARRYAVYRALALELGVVRRHGMPGLRTPARLEVPFLVRTGPVLNPARQAGSENRVDFGEALADAVRHFFPNEDGAEYKGFQPAR